jgi:hypothetical protein
VKRYPGCTFETAAEVARYIAYTAILDLLVAARAKEAGGRPPTSPRPTLLLPHARIIPELLTNTFGCSHLAPRSGMYSFRMRPKTRT